MTDVFVQRMVTRGSNEKRTVEPQNGNHKRRLTRLQDAVGEQLAVLLGEGEPGKGRKGNNIIRSIYVYIVT